MKQAVSKRQLPERFGAIIAVIVFASVIKMLPYLLKRFGWEVPVDQVWAYCWNLSPLLPLAVIAGTSLKRPWAFIVPVLAWFLGDIGIGFVTGDFSMAFHPMLVLTYLSLGLVVLIGILGAQKDSGQEISSQLTRNTLTGFAGATLFFVVSNFLLWALGREFLYPYTLSGLQQCFVSAIPFYRNSLLSMLIYVPILTLLIAPRTADASEQIQTESPVISS